MDSDWLSYEGVGSDAAESMSNANNARVQRQFSRKRLEERDRDPHLLPSGLGEAITSAAILVCVLVLGLGFVLVFSAVGEGVNASLVRPLSLGDHRFVGARPDGSRAEAAQIGPTKVLTDTTRVFLPGIYRSSKPDPSFLTERQRFGFVAVSVDWAQQFDVDRLHAGWYVDATVPSCGVAPAGTERALILGTNAGYSTNPAWLGPQVDRHPRTLWLIGNEPDCIWQDNLLPEEYAVIYHDLYTYIKNRDPTSQISPGGIVQPSPLRLEWLSRVLVAYRSAYGEDMPVDIWNIHNGILPEKKGDWGAEIPPGINAIQGVHRDIWDNDNLEIFQEQIWIFRQWMADNGYTGYPLIVSEYGILMPEFYGFGVDRVNRFMSATFDFFQNATDPELGDPSDEYRLVQRWAWFSLDVPPYDPDTNDGFNGNLFDPETRSITDFGLRFASRAGSYPMLHTVDLGAGVPRLLPPSIPVSPTQTVTRTMLLDVWNRGNDGSGPFSVTVKYHGPVSGVKTLRVENIAPVSSAQLTFVLTDIWHGRYQLEVKIDPENRVLESTECNNTMGLIMSAPSDITYLPLVAQSAP